MPNPPHVEVVNTQVSELSLLSVDADLFGPFGVMI
jgi:hypothetical protein